MQTNKVSPDSLRSPETSASQPRRNNVKATTNWNDVRSKELLRAEINRKKIYRDFIEKANIFNQAGEILRYSIARLESGWCRQLSHRQLTQERKRSETLSFLSLQWCALLTGIGFAIAVIDCEFEYQSSLLYCSDTDTYVRPTIAARDGLQCDKRVEFRARYENWQVYIRILNSACTLFLLIMLFVYHNCAIRVDYIRDPAFVTNPAMETPSAFMLLLKPSFLLEWCACAFHTAPFVTFSITTQDVGNTPITYSYQMISVLWMGARFYVIVRYIKESMLALQRAPCIEILAGLAKIKLDGRFASKMWFNHNSMIRLLGMLLVLLVYSAYCSNVCDRPIVDSQQLQFADSLWMIFITMTTVGFGDIVPKTHCSRFMAGCAMVGGLGVTSILVMYITNQILFSESETAIYNLVVANKLRNNLYSKASLLIQALFIDFRDKRAMANKALMSKKQNFETESSTAARGSIVFRAIENFKQAKADLNQFNMNKAEISDDSRLFKIQGDLNLIDHEINAGASGLASTELRLTYLEGGMARMIEKLDSLEVMLNKMCLCAGLDSTIAAAAAET